MVYIKRWAEFHSKCIELYKQSPNDTRYLIKATPSQQWLVLKVTDDIKCLKFKARSAIIINRFESFTRDMTALMASLPLPSEAAAAAAAYSTKANAMDIDTEATGAADSTNKSGSATTGNAASGGGSGGGANKKKKKKGKK